MSEILVAAFFVLLDTMSRSGKEKYTLQTVKGKNAERLQMLLQSCMRLRIYLSWMREDTDLLSYSIIDRQRVLKMQ